MIKWIDFELDEKIGPVLHCDSRITILVCRRTKKERASVTDDAQLLQETRQEKQPARMAGSFQISMDADRSELLNRRQGGV